MGKLLLLSLVIGTVAVPARAAREGNPRLGLRKALIGLAVFNLVYLLAIRFVWHHLF